MRQYQVSGDSMWPLLKHGQMVDGVKPDELQEQDIVIAEHPYRKKLIIKQISCITDDQIELRSMDPLAEDSRTFGPVPHRSIRAKIINV